MKTIRKLLCLFTAVVLVTFALPSTGANQSQNKTYTLTMSVLSQGTGLGDSTVQAVLTNTSPKQSSSTFSSFDLFVNFAWNITGCSAIQSGSTASFNVNCTSTPGHILVSNLSPVKPQGTVTVTFTVDKFSCGDATWDAAPWSGSQVGSGNFFIRPVPDTSAPLSTVACADLACDPAPESFSVGNVTGFRWSFNKDGGTGASCGATNAYVSDVDNTGNPIHFRWDGASDAFSTSVFYYEITYAPFPTAPTVGWLNKDGSLANAAVSDASQVAFVLAQACVGQVDQAANIETILPQPYASVKNAISPTSTTLKVDTTTPAGAIATPSTPFDIIVGPPGSVERMSVSAIGSNGWTVTRGVGTTSLGTGLSHPKGALVMSILLPVLPANNTCYDYQGNTISCPANGKYSAPYQAQACIAVKPANTTPALWWVDIGDTWSKP